MLRLGVLDQSPVRSGGAVADAIHETLELAEHHSTPGLAGSSPEVLIGQVAARTSRIRVGSGGVMLQHYSSLKVAESFVDRFERAANDVLDHSEEAGNALLAEFQALSPEVQELLASVVQPDPS